MKPHDNGGLQFLEIVSKMEAEMKRGEIVDGKKAIKQ